MVLCVLERRLAWKAVDDECELFQTSDLSHRPSKTPQDYMRVYLPVVPHPEGAKVKLKNAHSLGHDCYQIPLI
jgi:hypothetical protein